MQTVRVSDPGVTIEPAPTAMLGRSDVTRRWAMRVTDGSSRFSGVTRVEAERAASSLATLAPDDLDRALVRVELGVVLSEGAGPYLVDAVGGLVLVVGSHDALSDLSVAIGEARPDHDIGLVAALGSGVWIWRAMATIAPVDRVAALDGLAECGDLVAVHEWERTWARTSFGDAGG